ncbi:hypothetical protein M1555_03605 [Patescibacteria group bacterium]|nr:hypothetical protein [Patescibacteria group bacterium]
MTNIWMTTSAGVDRVEKQYDNRRYKGGDAFMMGWNYTYGNMAGWGGGNVFGLAVYLLVVVDLILLGLWLWKQLQKK